VPSLPSFINTFSVMMLLLTAVFSMGSVDTISVHLNEGKATVAAGIDKTAAAFGELLAQLVVGFVVVCFHPTYSSPHVLTPPSLSLLLLPTRTHHTRTLAQTHAHAHTHSPKAASTALAI
jgi:hypothetical protein